ncbi:MAG: hypothetical protein GF411_19165 [Candidatus Lokiarchaeota archaeon]|nr:hypothetical protein [Candidatus Lokiarchaeota archaeon]
MRTSYASIISIFMFLLVFSSFSGAAAQTSELTLNVGNTFDGELSEDNTRDRIELLIDEPGIYRLFLDYDNVTYTLGAEFYSLYSGFSVFEDSFTDTVIFEIVPVGLNDPERSYYVLIDSIVSITEDIEYELELELLEDVRDLTLDDDVSVRPMPEKPEWFKFDTTGNDKVYHFNFTDHYPAYMYIYDSHGMELFERYITTQSCHVLLDEGTYYIRINQVSSWADSGTMHVRSLDPVILNPDSSITISLDSTDEYYEGSQPVLIPVVDGVSYDLLAEPDSDVRPAVVLTGYGENTHSDNDNYVVAASATGYDLSLPDLTVFQNFVSFTSNSSDYKYLNYESLGTTPIAPHGFLLWFYSMDGSGDVDVSLSAGTPMQTIAPGNNQTISLDEEDGPTYGIYEVTGVSPMSLFDFNVYNNSDDSENVTVSYRILSGIWNQYSYWYEQMTYYDPQASSQTTKMLTTIANNFHSSDVPYDVDTTFFHHGNSKTYIMVYLSTTLMFFNDVSGDVEVGIVEIPPIVPPITGSTFVEVDEDIDTRILKTSIREGDTLGIRITRNPDTVFSLSSLYDSIGYMYAGGSSIDSDTATGNSITLIISGVRTADIGLFVSIFGESGITVEVIPVGISGTTEIIVIAAALIGGIALGAVLMILKDRRGAM